MCWTSVLRVVNVSVISRFFVLFPLLRIMYNFWVLFSFTSQKYLIQTTDVSVAIQLPSSMHKTVKHPRASLSTKHIKTAGKRGRGMAGEL